MFICAICGRQNNHPWGKKWFIRGEGYYRPPLSPPEVGRTGLSASWESLCVVCPYLECPLEVLLIVFLYNYAMNILCIKSGDGYDFYSMLKQAEIDVQLTSNRKLPNFYEKVTDFLLEGYRISKWWQNHAFIEVCRCCYKWRILTYWTIWLFIQIYCLFMHLCRLLIHKFMLEKLTSLYRKGNQPVWKSYPVYIEKLTNLFVYAKQAI